MPRRLYLDAHATTPADPEVVAAMLPFFNGMPGNPASPHHIFGRDAATAVQQAREQVARLIGASAPEILFTSGATESNNLVIQGAATRSLAGGAQLITAATEHSSVLDPCQAMARRGAHLSVLPVDGAGHLSSAALEQALTTPTGLVTLMAANNEIGTLHAMPEIAALTRSREILLHTDAAQAVGLIPVDVEAWGVDFLSLSGHKFYGPKGAGALYVRGGTAGAEITPVVHGGGQEDGLRPGTMNVPAIVGLGEACRLAESRLAVDGPRLAMLRDRLQARLLAGLDGVTVNGDEDSRLPHNLNITIPGIDGRCLAAEVDHLALSTGSACASALPKPSHVLLALGLSREAADSSIRFGLLRSTQPGEIDEAADRVISAVERIRRPSRQA
jgi:cysteine desulfurase